jgi:hypothetical protein
VTLADALAVPPAPVQTMAKVLELVNTPLDSLPEVALLPDQAPEAVQELASVDDQLRVEEPPLTTELGFAVSDTVGSGGGGVLTVTVVDALALPPEPVQRSAKVLVLVNTPLDSLPEIGLLPDHAPEAVQEFASVDDQLSVEELPLTTEAGFAVSDTVGTGAVTVTLADALAVPPSPPQIREKVLELVSTPLDWLPEVALLPDHAPAATQELESLDDQVSVEDPPLATEAGFAHSDTVGNGGGGGAPDTVTVVDALVLPPEPVHVREKLVLAASLAVG